MKKKYIIQFVLILLGTILYFMANLQRVAVPGTIFDLLLNGLKTNPATITALGASFTYFYAISQLLVGFFINRYGGYRVLSFGAVIFSVGVLLFPFSHSVIILYISRALVGMGASTFYLSMISEVQKIVSHKNFGVVLSIILFIGYLGGIVAGFPILVAINKYGWESTFKVLAILTVITAVLYLISKNFIPKQEPNENAVFNFEIYKRVLFKKSNIILYLFGCLNYSIYYLFQTVLGKKFLEDFTGMLPMHAAIILSVMGFAYAIAGPTLATMSKFLLQRRAIFIKIAGINTFCSMLIILICIILSIKTPLLCIIFCTLALFASLTPLLIPIIYDMSSKEDASISISIMTSMFFLIVAIMSNITGEILYLFTPVNMRNEAIVYSDSAYLTIFILLTAVASISLFCALQIKDTQLTQRLIKIQKIKNKFD